MTPKIYIETSIVSYLTAWPARDAVRRGQQDITKQWWRNRRPLYAIYTSQFVLDEAAAGDSKAASERIKALAGIDLLDISPEVEPLADKLITGGALPTKARVDALHLATATLNGMDYLLTWNCKHLANAFLWDMIKRTCNSSGYDARQYARATN